MRRPKVVVTRALPDVALRALADRADVWVSPHDRPLTEGELHQAVGGAGAVLTMLHDRVDEAFLEAAGGELRCVANVAVGYDNIDLTAAARRGVVVTNTPDVLTDATADLAIALMLMITRRLGEGERLVRSGSSWAWSFDFMLGCGLRSKALGIVGLGRIGRATALRARSLGMEILYNARHRAPAETERELDARPVTLDELFTTADVVSLHCPLTSETRHIVDASVLARMRTEAFVVNTARGPLIDERALADALERRQIAGAALDVFEHEPDVEPRLHTLDNVVLVPHLGSATIETRSAMADLAARNALAVIDGRPPLTPVDPPPAATGT